MRKTRVIRQRVKELRAVAGVIEVVWLKNEGYYTYQLFFKYQNEAESQIKMLSEKYPKTWVEYVGYAEIECENELCTSFWTKGYVLEITFLE